jgi:XTP/dITP diphosphohydrolase
VISIAMPTGPALTYEGRCEGTIARAPAGTNGFGYDPVFFYPPLNKTFAQLTMAEKAGSAIAAGRCRKSWMNLTK